MSEKKRRFGRFEVSLPAEISAGDLKASGIVKNLSVGGVYIETSQSFALGSKVDVQIELSTPYHVIYAKATVSWQKGDEGVGVSFEHLRPIDVWSIIQQTQSPSDAILTGQEN
jgi:hypothetical protein